MYNTMLMFQTIQLFTGCILTVLIILSIATQTPVHQFIGTEGCHFYYMVITILGISIFLSSLGMAIYRLFCFRNLMMKAARKKNLIKYILIGELGICIIWTLELIGVTLHFGNPPQNFCMNHGYVFAKIFHRYDGHQMKSYFCRV